MIRSMTAFATSRTEQEAYRLVWELRCVNHRYLEINSHLPDVWRHLETELRARCRQQLERGKVDIRLRYDALADDSELQLNKRKVEQLAELTREAGDIILHAGPVSLTDILALPGVMHTKSPDLAPVKTAALGLFDEALQQLVANREREGAELKRFIDARLTQISEQVAAVRQALPEILKHKQEQLAEQARELAATDPERLEQALVTLLQRLDVAEELDRLDAHVKEAHYQLEQPPATNAQDKKSLGRRLDFLMQEFNREANTLGSKSAAIDTTRAAVELKVLIEQIREQVQNIE